ncbi:MAG: glycosyltransferase involved in cell wall biosynthesis [Polaribacter sp.]|jgi:glycosyltransferase involved in cell wall biosynthesis
MRNLKILAVFHKSTHHSGYSGYAQFLNYIKNIKRIFPTPILMYFLAKKIAKKIGKGLGNYDSNSFYKDLQIIINILKNRKDNLVVHYLNGERDIRLALSFFAKKKNVKFIATFHKPPTILGELVINKKYLKKLDGAIVVGINQLDFIKKELGIKKGLYIPHGVDTTFFKPNYKLRPQNTKIILFVGQHLRDFDIFNNTIELLLNENKEHYIVNVILRKEYQHKIIKNSKVNIYSGVSDIDLRKHYQAAHVLFIPFKEVTACNSILEGLACGCPIVTTKVGGNSEYLKNTMNILVPQFSDFNIYKEAIKILIAQDNDFKISKSSRMKSNDYEWREIAREVNSFYKSFYS